MRFLISDIALYKETNGLNVTGIQSKRNGSFPSAVYQGVGCSTTHKRTIIEQTYQYASTPKQGGSAKKDGDGHADGERIECLRQSKIIVEHNKAERHEQRKHTRIAHTQEVIELRIAEYTRINVVYTKPNKIEQGKYQQRVEQGSPLTHHPRSRMAKPDNE